MTVQQSLATLGRSTVPLIAAAIVLDLGVDPALVGVYLAIGSVAGFMTTMGCGGFILRFGALRMTQVGMAALGAGLAITTAGWLPLFAAGAFVGGLGQALSTPSSSHLLGSLASASRVFYPTWPAMWMTSPSFIPCNRKPTRMGLDVFS